MNTNGNITAETHSLWSLLENKDKVIVIPDYQREYAYGRQTDDARQIRKAFIEVLVNALIKNNPIELSFIYGAQAGEEFHLVDGQQRLTTLFALYWYVLLQAEEDFDRLKNFTYKTRTSSNTFFNKLLEIKIIKELLPENEILNQSKRYPDCGQIEIGIREKPWFTGVMYSDPTVRSMLVVLDELHSKFKIHNGCNWNDLAERLMSEPDKCPIVFKALDMEDALGGGEDTIQDLYIKMNSRGKLLTDFEIFKSLLSKKTSETDLEKLDLLNSCLGDEDNNTNRITFISKFNCEYANAFFKIVDEGKIIDNTGGSTDNNTQSDKETQGFDRAMMNFINEVFRIDYVVAGAKEGTPRSEYEPYYNKIGSLNGKGLFSWIENHGILEEELMIKKDKNINGLIGDKSNVDNVFTNALRKINHLFGSIATRSKEASFNFFDDNYCYINEKWLLCDLNKDNIVFQDTVRRYGIFQFWDKIFDKDRGLPDLNTDLYNAYAAWSRFVYNMTYEVNAEEDQLYKAVENVCQECQFFDKMIESIGKSGSINEKTIYEAITNNNYEPAVRFKIQFEEEKVKAELMLKPDDWKDDILDAEKKYTGSRIWPILEMSEKNDKYDIDSFKHWSEVFSWLFDSDYKLKKEIDASLFEKALLCMKDYTKNKTGHLAIKDMYKFLGENSTCDCHEILSRKTAENQRERHEIILSLIEEIGGGTKEPSEINGTLYKIVECEKQNVSGWKKAFIEDFIIGKEIKGFGFKRGITPDTNFVDEKSQTYTLLYNTTERRSDTAELYSFILACRLSENDRSKVEYHPAGFRDYFYDDNDNKKPRRYLIYGGTNIYYYNGNKGIGFYNQQGDFLGETVEAAEKCLNPKS